MADLMPDDVVEHPLGGEQQAPVEAHVPVATSTTPSGCAARGSPGRCRRCPETAAVARSRRCRDLGAGRPAIEALERRARRRRPAPAGARRSGARVCDRPAGRARGHGRGRAPSRRARRSASSTSRRSARRRSIHGRSSLTAAWAARSGAPRGQHDLHAGVGVHVHPHPPRAGRAADRVGDVGSRASRVRARPGA